MQNSKQPKLQSLMDTLRYQSASGGIPSDVLGSYTGSACDGDRPIQDADDL